MSERKNNKKAVDFVRAHTNELAIVDYQNTLKLLNKAENEARKRRDSKLLQVQRLSVAQMTAHLDKQRDSQQSSPSLEKESSESSETDK